MSALPPIQTLDEFEVAAAAVMKPAFTSKFHAVPWNQMQAKGPEHRWLVKGLITDGELSMLAGASQSGKSFLTLDLAMSVARGIDWFGRKVEQGGVVYQAGEGATGLRRKRIPAYMKDNVLGVEDDVPFVLLPARVNLWDGAAHTEDLIAEIKHWSHQMTVPLRLIIIDTLSKAMTGADEISGKDIGVVIDRCDMIRRATGAAVLLVHHMNAGGEKVRGHTSILANLDSVLICRMAVTPGGRGVSESPIVDQDGRKVRELMVGKAKDGESEVKPDRFVLRSVEIGRDEDGDAITSCVVAPPGGDDLAEQQVKAKKAGLSVRLSFAMKALVNALEAVGRAPPAQVSQKAGASPCVTLADWRDAFERLASTEDEDPVKLKERIKKARDRAAADLITMNYIKKDGDWVWRTSRFAKGIDRPPFTRADPLDQHEEQMRGLDDVVW